MGRVYTDLRDTQDEARRHRFEPVTIGNATISATDVQTAIQQVANIAQNPPQPTPIPVTATPYVVGPTDRILEVNFAGNVAITMGPTSARNGLDIEIKDVSGGLNAGPFTITMTADATDVNGFDGQAHLVIATDFESFRLRPEASGLVWRVAA